MLGNICGHFEHSVCCRNYSKLCKYLVMFWRNTFLTLNSLALRSGATLWSLIWESNCLPSWTPKSVSLILCFDRIPRTGPWEEWESRIRTQRLTHTSTIFLSTLTWICGPYGLSMMDRYVWECHGTRMRVMDKNATFDTHFYDIPKYADLDLWTIQAFYDGQVCLTMLWY